MKRISKTICIRSNVQATLEVDPSVDKKVFHFAPLYSGGEAYVDGYDAPVYVDVESLKIDNNPKCCLDHNMDDCVGYLTNIEKKQTDEGRLGVFCDAVVGGSPLAKRVIEAQDCLAPWSCSIGAYRINVKDVEFVDDASKVIINGAYGNAAPAYIVRNASLVEGSFVNCPGDQGARVVARMKANKGLKMTFEEFVADKGLDLASLTEEEIAALQEEYNASQNAEEEEVTAEEGEGETEEEKPEEVIVEEIVETALEGEEVEPEVVEEIIEEIVEEVEDVIDTPEEEIAAIAKQKCKAKCGKVSASIKEKRRIEAIKAACGHDNKTASKAIEGGWSVKRVNAYIDAKNKKVRRMSGLKNAGIGCGYGNSGINKATQLKVAFAIATGMTPERAQRVFKTDQRTVNAAMEGDMKNISFRTLLAECNKSAGLTANMFTSTLNLYNDAVTQKQSKWGQRVSAGFSTISAIDVINAVAQAYLEPDESVQQCLWRNLTQEVFVDNLKEVKSYNVGVDGGLVEVPTTGQVPTAGLTEAEYTQQAITHGRVFKVPQQIIINDDIDYFGQVVRNMATVAEHSRELEVAKCFWGLINGDTNAADSAAFVSTARGNLITGSTSALSETGLGLAEKALAASTSLSGIPLSMDNCILVTGNSLKAAGRKLYNSEFVDSGTGKGYWNAYAGMFRPYAWSYLDKTFAGTDSNKRTYTKGDTLWMLLRDPAMRPAVKSISVRGFEGAQIRQDLMDVNYYGIGWQVVYHFGVAPAFTDAIVVAEGA